jgi:fibrobacter succinogenes major paralogous domain
MATADDIDNNVQNTRIAFYPEVVSLDKIGLTAEEEEGQNVIVTLNPKGRKSMKWTAEVDKTKTWCTLTESKIVDADGITQRGFKITATENSAYKRIADVTVTAADGTKEVLQVIQTGVYPDAEITVEPDKIEFNADEIVPVDVTFTTNMGDVYAVTKDEDADWISWEDLGDNVIRFMAQQWENEEEPRSANVYITVGSEDTTTATATIPVTQLAKDIYCYLWGATLFDYDKFELAQRMTKADVGIYRYEAYFAAGSKAEIRVNTVMRADYYPAYALDADGRIVTLNSAADQIPAGPAIDIDGMRTLTIDLNAMTYNLTRIATANCMTDEAAALCASKEYTTKDGKKKTWMTSNLNWNGGPNIGPMKLGSRLVPGNNAGGYGNVQPYTERLSKYDEAESGGEVQGSQEMTDKYGRLYSINEFLLGVPQGALSTGYNNVEWPSGYSVGDTFTDAVGTKIVGKLYPATTLKAVANDEQYFADNPALSAQIQGICPYGWHIANFRDWYDLAYAALEASRGDATYPVKEAMLTIPQLVVTNANNVAPWLRTQEGWLTTPARATGAEAFGFNLFPTGWRLYKDGYAQYGDTAHNWVPLMGSSTKKTWRLNNVKVASNYWFNDNLDAGNPAVGIRCVKNYKIKK